VLAVTAAATFSPYSETAERILGVAEGLAQTRGFHAFSYADIAAELGITKASLHYHFATKAELGHTLLVRYSQRFAAALAALDDEPDPRQRLYRYAQIYESVLVRDRMCLCGMFAAEYQTLPVAMQRELRRFFDANEAWLAKNLSLGRESGVLVFAGSAEEAARTLTATLEGAMLLARAYEEPARFTATAHSVLAGLTRSRL
jgi:TetR/AcrR family transcriptional regulator, transcriptional repressor for nem operon